MIDSHAMLQLSKGLLTFVPGLGVVVPKKGTGGSTSSALYCYGVWLKHLALLHNCGMGTVPDTIAELGPGESIGVGVAALLCGAKHYRGLDVVAHADTAANLAVVDELVALFKGRVARPTRGWPDFDHLLSSSLFPESILTEDALSRTLEPGRIANIKRAIMQPGTVYGGISVQYFAPWYDPAIVSRGSCGLVFSHNVLECVDDLTESYCSIADWLAPGGYMSHQIDLGSYGSSSSWNGYRSYSELTWNIIQGRRPFRINREPASSHVAIAKSAGFRIERCEERIEENGLRIDQLAKRWKGMSDRDLTISGLFLQAAKN